MRRQAARQNQRLHYAYVLDQSQRVLGVLSFRELFQAPPDAIVQNVMRSPVLWVAEHADQEDVARQVREHGLLSIPVLDVEGRMVGIVTADDIVDVVEEEATEDIQKLGGSAALEAAMEPHRACDVHWARSAAAPGECPGVTPGRAPARTGAPTS